jgi:hypothetical protein
MYLFEYATGAYRLKALIDGKITCNNLLKFSDLKTRC